MPIEFTYHKRFNEIIATNFPKRSSKQQALKGSIAKWELIIATIKENKRGVYDGAAETCALCHKYCLSDPAYRCHGCPIYEKTGKSDCIGTPRDKYVQSHGWKSALKAAEAEVAFLQELLKEAHAKD